MLIATSKIHPVVYRSKKEKYFIDPFTGKSVLFPALTDKSSVHLSVIIPAYNEEERCNIFKNCIYFVDIILCFSASYVEGMCRVFGK